MFSKHSIPLLGYYEIAFWMSPNCTDIGRQAGRQQGQCSHLDSTEPWLCAEKKKMPWGKLNALVVSGVNVMLCLQNLQKYVVTSVDSSIIK